MEDAGDAQLREYQAKMREIHTRIKSDRDAGEVALRRLFRVAQGNSGQCEKVAKLLLGLYNGTRFPLDLTNLRGLDYDILEDCLTVLRMDANAYQEVHLYFENGSQRFERLAADYGLAALELTEPKA